MNTNFLAAGFISLAIISGTSLIFSAIVANLDNSWIRVGGIGSGLFLIICAVLVGWGSSAYSAFLQLGFMFHSILDNGLLKFFSISPIAAWALWGAIIALCIALWKEAPTYGFKKSRVALIILPIVMIGVLGYLGYSNVVKSQIDKSSVIVEKYGKVIRDNVSVRDGPGTNYTKVGVAPKGSRLRLFEEVPSSDGHTWRRVEVMSEKAEKQLSGFIRQDFVEVAKRE